MPRRKGDAKASYKLTQILEPGFELPSDRTELLKIYRTVAKAADQRLVRLEELTKEENFGDADKWAYARAIRDIEQYSGEGAKRFNRKPPQTMTGLLAKIEDIKTFLKAPSSTKSGIKEVYVNRANKINEDYGTDFKWQDMGKFFDNKGWRYLAGDKRRKEDGKYESGTVLKSIAMVRKKYTKEELQEAIKNINKTDLKVPDDQIGRTIKSILKNKNQSKIFTDLLYE